MRWMILAAVSFSLYPLFYKLGRAEDSILLFTGLWFAGTGTGIGLAVTAVMSRHPLPRGSLAGVAAQCKSVLMLVSVAGVCGFAMFTTGLLFVDASVAAVLYETWPVLLILLMPRLFPARDGKAARFHPVSWFTSACIVMAVAGVVMVVLSHGSITSTWEVSYHPLGVASALVGAVLALGAGVGQAAQTAATLKMGASLALAHARRDERGSNEVMFTAVVVSLCHVAGGVLLCLAGLAVSETIAWSQVPYIIVGGFVITPVGSIAFRLANLKTRHLGVNAIAFTAPVLALLWLWGFSMIDVLRLDYLVIGSLCIVIANILIHIEVSLKRHEG